MTRKPFVLAIAVAILLGVSCTVGPAAHATPTLVGSSRLPPVQPISGVAVADDGQGLQVAVGCPKGEPIVKVTETRRAVTVSARYVPTHFMCLRLASVTLKTPLGARRILDAMTHKPIPRKPFLPLPPTTS